MQPAAAPSLASGQSVAPPPVWVEPRRSWFVEFLTSPFKDIDMRARYQSDAREAVRNGSGRVKSAAPG